MTSSPSQSDPVRWGILGCGAIASWAVCPALRWSPITELRGIASRSAARAEAKAREVEAPRAYGSYQEIVDDPDIDVIYLGVPNGLHEKWGTAALKAGKHVMCEKSLALSSAAARRMVEAAGQSGVRLMEAFMYRHHPQWNLVRDTINSGEIGEVVLVRAGLAGQLLDSDNYRWSSVLGGGALYDVTCYAVNLARMIMRREPLSVFSLADRNTVDEVDRTSTVVMDFGFGRLATATGSLSAANYQYCEIHGTRGSISVEHPFIPGWQATTVTIERGMNRDRVEVSGANHFLHEIEHFALCARDPGRPLSPAEDGLCQALVNEAVAQSWDSQKLTEVLGE